MGDVFCRLMRRLFIPALMLGLMAAPLTAQDLSALARLNPAESEIVETGAGVGITLALSQPVPWRVRLMDAPPRLIIDTREVDWTGIAALQRVDSITALRAGVFRQGWSRLVLQLAGPVRIAEAGVGTGGPPAPCPP